MVILKYGCEAHELTARIRGEIQHKAEGLEKAVLCSVS
jgi:hypothetical protein